MSAEEDPVEVLGQKVDTHVDQASLKMAAELKSLGENLIASGNEQNTELKAKMLAVKQQLDSNPIRAVRVNPVSQESTLVGNARGGHHRGQDNQVELPSSRSTQQTYELSAGQQKSWQDANDALKFLIESGV